MIIKNGICYATSPSLDSKNGVRIVSAEPLVGGMLLVGFATGEQRLFDTTLLEGPAFEPLRSKKIQDTVKVEHGFISWDDGSIDVAPEYIYAHSYAYNPTDVIVA